MRVIWESSDIVPGRSLLNRKSAHYCKIIEHNLADGRGSTYALIDTLNGSVLKFFVPAKDLAQYITECGYFETVIERPTGCD